MTLSILVVIMLILIAALAWELSKAIQFTHNLLEDVADLKARYNQAMRDYAYDMKAIEESLQELRNKLPK